MSDVLHGIGIGNASDPADLTKTDFSKGEAAAAFDQSGYAANKDSYLQQQLAAAQARTAPVSTAAQNNGVDVRNLQYGGANIDKTAQFGGAQLGATPQGTAAQLGPAAQAGDVSINRQDEQFRNAQLGLQGQLQTQAAGGGPSVAESQLKAATDRNIANQAALAASQGGRNAGTVQRGLSIGAVGANMGAAQAAAQMRVQEQQAAQQQLAGLTSAGRSADIGVNTAQAQLTQGGNQFNVGAQNQVQLQQGQFGQQMNLANLQNQVSNQQLQAQMMQQAGLSNQSAVNSRAQAQAGLLQQAGLAGSAAQTQGYLSNTQNQQQTNLANQGAQLQQQQLNDAMQKYLTEAGLGVDTRAQEAQMAKQGLATSQNMGLMKTQAAGDEAASDRFGGFMKSVAGYAAMSDEDVKHGVTSGNEKIKQYLNSFSNQVTAAGNQDSGPTRKGNAFGGGLSSNDPKADAAIKAGVQGMMTPAQVDPSAQMSGSTSGTAAPVGIDPNAAVAMDVSDENTKTKIDEPTVVPLREEEGGTEMHYDRDVKQSPVKGTLESSSEGAKARETAAASKPSVPASTPRRMTNEELAAHANAMLGAQQTQTDSQLGRGAAATGNKSWLDTYMDKETSDEHAKGQIHDADSKIKSFLDNIHAHSYEYKPGFKDPATGGGEGQFISPMAQELEKSELGREMVQKDAQGIRHVDYDKAHANGTMTAALAYLNEELKKKKDK